MDTVSVLSDGIEFLNTVNFNSCFLNYTTN
jgi:hypothetical protein